MSNQNGTSLAVQDEFSNFITLLGDEEGAEIKAGIPYETWQRDVNTAANAAQNHGKAQRQALIILGDLFNAGEREFGERYSQALGDGRISEKTVQNIMWICSRVPANERHPSLSLGHLGVVAGIKDAKIRKEIVELAVSDDLSVEETRELRRVKCPSKKTAAPKPAKQARIEPERGLTPVEAMEMAKAVIDHIKLLEGMKPLKSWTKTDLGDWPKLWAEFRKFERRAGLGHGAKK